MRRRPALTAVSISALVLAGLGRALLVRLTVRHTRPAQLIAAGAALVLLPVARVLPALATLGLITAVLVAQVCYERITWQPTAAAR